MNSNIDKTALYDIGYGLYIVTSKNEKHNGLIVNAVMQIADSPCQVAVCINKQNYSHDVIKETKKLNINCLDETAPFGIFEKFGFASGRDTDKLSDMTYGTSANGLCYLKSFVNSVICAYVTDYIDLGSHGMFICQVVESFKLSDKPSMTYAYYHKNVKPKPQKSKGYVCKICGYVYEGEPLPEDFICPLCKHPASDFEKVI